MVEIGTVGILANLIGELDALVGGGDALIHLRSDIPSDHRELGWGVPLSKPELLLH